MVIQSNMSPKAIVKVWGSTADVFKKYDIPLTDQPLEKMIEAEKIFILLKKLNDLIGSSKSTCIKGG